jgi:hypothetical protein
MTAPSKARYDAGIDAGLTAIRRWGKLGELARVVATLAREGGPCTVGQPTRVDGGLGIATF